MSRTIVNINAQTSERTEVPISDEEWDSLIANAPVEPKIPDWDMLYGRLLAYDLKPIFESIKAIAKKDAAINWDLTALATAIATIRTEQALKDCLDELVVDGYVISDEHKSLWNNVIAELHFSDLVKL
jgi:hypothetical protein